MNEYSSPWQSAGNAMSGIGDSLTRMVLQIAQQRQHENEYAQQMALKQQELAQQQALYRSHLGLYDAQAGEAATRAAREKLQMDAASQFGDAMGRGQLPPVQAPQQMGLEALNPGIGGSLVPYDAINQVQSQDIGQDQSKWAGVISALAGQPQRAADFETKNMMNRALGPNMDPRLARAKLLGEKSMTVPHQGGVYDPISQIITAVMPQLIQAGAMQTGGTTGLPEQSSPSKPVAMRSSTGQNAALQLLSKVGSIDMGNEAFGAPFMQAIMNMATNSAPTTATSPAVAPAPQRKVGDRVTTAKGTFSWNGQGWDPVQQ